MRRPVAAEFGPEKRAIRQSRRCGTYVSNPRLALRARKENARRSFGDNETIFTYHRNMLYAAIALFLIAIVAAIFGFGGIAASIAGLAKIAFFVFLVLAIFSLVFGLVRKSK